MDIRTASRGNYLHTVGWGLLASAVIVGTAAGLGRATVNLRGALTDKPDIAIYLLLPNEGITTISLLRETDMERHYLAETKFGPKLIVLKMGEKEWYVQRMESLHESSAASSAQSASPETETLSPQSESF